MNGPWYAHTAETPDGRPDPDWVRWQPLATHRCDVSAPARVLWAARATRLPRLAARRPESLAHQLYETLSHPSRNLRPHRAVDEA